MNQIPQIHEFSPLLCVYSSALPSVAVIHFNGEFYVMEVHVASDCVRTCFGMVDTNSKTIHCMVPA